MSVSDSTQPQPWSRSLLDLLQRQRTMMDDLVDLAQSQTSLVADGHADQLLNLLAKRQAIIDEFTVSQSQLATYTQALDERVETLANAERNRIKSLINEIGDRLAQVMQRDEQDEAMLRRNRDQIKQELNTLGSAKKARSAYQPTPARTDRFADRHG